MFVTGKVMLCPVLYRLKYLFRFAMQEAEVDSSEMLVTFSSTFRLTLLQHWWKKVQKSNDLFDS